MTSLAEVAALAKTGRGGVAFVEGEAGIEKTRLLAETLGAAEGQGFQVFYGRCEQWERMRPFGSMAQAFSCARSSSDPRLARIARLVAPEHDGAGDLAQAGTLEYRGAEAFLDLLEHHCSAGPVALALEDLHWADYATLLAIRVLARRVRALPVVLLATLRPIPASRELTSLVGTCVDEGALHLSLGPLAPALVNEMAAEALGGSPGPRLCEQLAGTAGNPLFVVELARALIQENRITVVNGYAEVDLAQTPRTLPRTILRRLGALSEPTLELLRLGAVLGPTFSPTDLAIVVGRSVTALMPALEEALRAGVLGEAGDRLAFRHDLVHEALYGELPLGVRAGVHRDIARALAASGASALQLAQHLLLGASLGDNEAVASLREAAGQVAARSPQMAAELLTRAVELTDASSPGRDELVAERVTALLWSGRVLESATLAGEVLRRAHDPGVEGVLCLARARALFMVGRIEVGLQVLDACETSPRLTIAQRTELRADQAYGRAMSGQFEEAESLARRAREDTELAGEDLPWCVVTGALSLVAFFRGQLDHAIDLAAAAVSRAEASPNPLARRYGVHYFLAVFLLEADRFADADEVLLSGRRMNQEWGTTWVLPMLEWVSAARRFFAGDWDDAVAAAEAGLAMAGDQGSRLGLDCAQGLAGLVAAYRKQPAGGRLVIEPSTEPLEVSPSGLLVGTTGVIRGLLAEARGCPDQALAILEEYWRRATDAGAAVDYRLLGPQLVRLALSAGAVQRAEAVAAAVDQLAVHMGTAGARGAALRCRGLLDADGDTLLASAVAYDRAGRPVERAFALEEAGAALAASGRRAEAGAALLEALRVYDALAASAAIARTEARMRALGVRRGARGRRPRPQEGWESLTESEQRVVALVSRGLTNVQIGAALGVSRHTVESHVSHVFTKLRLASRTELAARVVARGMGLS